MSFSWYEKGTHEFLYWAFWNHRSLCFAFTFFLNQEYSHTFISSGYQDPAHTKILRFHINPEMLHVSVSAQSHLALTAFTMEYCIWHLYFLMNFIRRNPYFKTDAYLTFCWPLAFSYTGPCFSICGKIVLPLFGMWS